MSNFLGKIECPHCYDFIEFNSSPDEKSVMLGDMIEHPHTSKVTTFRVKCPTCKNTFFIQAIIKQGQLTKYNPFKEEKAFDLLDFATTKTLSKGSYRYYSYDERSAYLLGEDTMFLVDFNGIHIRKDMVYPVFDKLWNIDKVFKECINPELSSSKYERLKEAKEKNFICEVSTEDGIRKILILREGYFPTLRAPSWDNLYSKINHDNYKRLSTYILPENNILAVCGTR